MDERDFGFRFAVGGRVFISSEVSRPIASTLLTTLKLSEYRCLLPVAKPTFSWRWTHTSILTRQLVWNCTSAHHHILIAWCLISPGMSLLFLVRHML